MHGALLRSGRSESFAALGESGQPVYRAALQLREAIRRTSSQMANHLAIPQSNELGSRIDWYSPIQGDVIPWSVATDEERTPARVQLEALRLNLNRLSDRFLGGEQERTMGDKAVFGKLLRRVIYFPDENFIYLVNGTPVLTFWGFLHSDDDRNLEPLHCLYPRSIIPTAITPTTATLLPSAASPSTLESFSISKAVQPSPWWRRWWWLLPLLLLLLLLPLLLRSCVPNLQPPGLSEGKMPEVPTLDSSHVHGDLQLPASTLATGGLQAEALPDTTPGGRLRPPTDELLTMQQFPSPLANNTQPAAGAAPLLPIESGKSKLMQNSPAVGKPALLSKSPASPDASPALSIPSNAPDGAADFLSGNWQAGAGIQDRRTGKPLRLEYRFNNGQGAVTVRRSDGVSCTGPVSAAMHNGGLSIDSQGHATCSDGSSYEMPQVGCQQDAQSIAECSGRYGSEQFPMSMRQISE